MHKTWVQNGIFCQTMFSEMFLLILRSKFQIQVLLPASVTPTAMVNPKLGRITKPVFKGKLPEKYPKVCAQKTDFTAYCEESENYCIVSSVECSSLHQVGQNFIFSFKNSGINKNFSLYDFYQKYITFLGVSIKVEIYHCIYSLVNIVLQIQVGQNTRNTCENGLNTFENQVKHKKAYLLSLVCCDVSISNQSVC